jgi:uncharacterized protein DUF6529
MEDFVEGLARGNVAQVKTVLASIVLILAAYQLALMAVGYGKLRLPFLKPKAASFAHRAVGDTTVAITLRLAARCRVDRRDHHRGRHRAIGPGADARDLRELQRLEEERREERVDGNQGSG